MPAEHRDGGGAAVVAAPPPARRRQTLVPSNLSRRRSLAIRHVSGHRLVALLEIVSPAYKDRAQHVDAFAADDLAGVDQEVPVGKCAS